MDRNFPLTCNMLPNQCASLEKAEELCTAGCCNGDPGFRPDHGSVETTTFFNYQVCKGFSVVDMSIT